MKLQRIIHTNERIYSITNGISRIGLEYIGIEVSDNRSKSPGKEFDPTRNSYVIIDYKFRDSSKYYSCIFLDSVCVNGLIDPKILEFLRSHISGDPSSDGKEISKCLSGYGEKTPNSSLIENKLETRTEL